jgi:ketosteroid isomerase-like protein
MIIRIGVRAFAAALAVMLLAGPAGAHAPVDERAVAKAVRAVLEAQEAAWNAGDIEGFMDGYWRHRDLRFASGGTVTTGWLSTLERYQVRYETPQKMGRLAFTDLDVTVLGSDAALVFGRWALERAEDRPAGLFTLLFRKTDRGWVIVHDHTSAE